VVVGKFNFIHMEKKELDFSCEDGQKESYWEQPVGAHYSGTVKGKKLKEKI